MKVYHAIDLAMPGSRHTADDSTVLPARPEDARRGGRLLVVTAGGTEIHDLPEQGVLVLGRSTECDVTIADRSVSRRHAQLHIGPPLAIEDLASSAGTRLAGAAIPSGERVPLPAGTAVELGAVLLLVQPRASHPPTAEGQTSMERVRELAALVARSDISVLIVGETGVGKEVLAEAIHDASPRASGPLLRLNCAALPEALLESELFGHERGAFTGAVQQKPGLLEAARGGTVLLDEVGELGPVVQAKLLRVLESGEVLRLGGLAPRPIDVRFISATHRDIGALTSAGHFRVDLYYRLAGFTIAVPPLRERRSDIAALAEKLLVDACERLGRARPQLSSDAVAVLQARPWPGNVRELRNVMERAVLLCDGASVLPVHVSVSAPGSMAPAEDDATSSPPIDEKERIADALRRVAGNQTRAAELLGMSRRTLLRKLDTYQLTRPRKP